MKADNAVILAAGTSSRFAPLSYETHKALIEVRGEILIERQIRQLLESGVPEIFIVTGYREEQFTALEKKFGVHLIPNPEYNVRNNNSSIYAAKEVLGNTWLCSADNYFTENPFLEEPEDAFYSAVYAEGKTKEWCLKEDEKGYICEVKIGGEDSWYMLGHTFWSEAFSGRFLKILEEEYDLPRTRDMLWESIYMEHLDELKMKIRKYGPGIIFEFDSLDELRGFDPSYIADTRSKILKQAASELDISEADIQEIRALKDKDNTAVGCTFRCPKGSFSCRYDSGSITKL